MALCALRNLVFFAPFSCLPVSDIHQGLWGLGDRASNAQSRGLGRRDFGLTAQDLTA